MECILLGIGKKIKIRKNLSEKQSYNSSFGINDDMEKFRGKTAVITEMKYVSGEENPIRRCRYKLDIDDGDWTWGIDMFDLNSNMLELE